MFETNFDRHVESITGEICAIARELKYYRGIAHEQAEVIKQLSGEPTEGGVVYIHPSDFMILINSIREPDYWLEYRSGDMVRSESIGGVRYKQSAFMPVHFKGIFDRGSHDETYKL